MSNCLAAGGQIAAEVRPHELAKNQRMKQRMEQRTEERLANLRGGLLGRPIWPPVVPICELWDWLE